MTNDLNQFIGWFDDVFRGARRKKSKMRAKRKQIRLALGLEPSDIVRVCLQTPGHVVVIYRSLHVMAVREFQGQEGYVAEIVDSIVALNPDVRLSAECL